MEMGIRVAARAGRTLIVLEYPTSAHPGPRYGHGSPPNPHLQRLIETDRSRYKEHLESIQPLLESLGTERNANSDGQGDLYWTNIWLSGIDAISLYYFLASREAKRYVEIGSGMSTHWARRAIEHGGQSTTVTSIDPHPREEVEEVCDVVIRHPLETTTLSVFEELEAGDVVFMDGSHRVFTNSDASVFMLDVLPLLPPGVLVGIHEHSAAVRLPAPMDPTLSIRSSTCLLLTSSAGRPVFGLSCRVTLSARIPS